jgi:hypothetical protein
MKKTYQFKKDRAGNVFVAVSTGSCTTCTTYNLVPTLSNAPTADSKSQFIGSSPTGFTGILDAPDTFFQQLGMIPCTLSLEGICNAIKSSNGRRSGLSSLRSDIGFHDKLLAGSAQYHRRAYLQRRALNSNDQVSEVFDLLGPIDDSSVTGVQTPLLCIKAGDGVTWSITAYKGVTHYPEYVVDSLYNTNPSFDYGALQNLKKDIDAGRPVSSFNQIFLSAGVYSFRDAGDPLKQTVVGVVNPLVNCPPSFARNPVQSLSADLLKDFPSGEKAQAVITPDYALIAGIGTAIMATLLLGVCSLHVTRLTGWGREIRTSRRYRDLQKGGAEDLHSMASKKHVVKTGQQTNFEEQSMIQETCNLENQALIDLEGFNIQTLFDKLQDQTNLVSEQLNKQKDDVKEFYEKVERTLTTRSGAYSTKGSTELQERALKREDLIWNEVARRKELGALYVTLLCKEGEVIAEAGIAQMDLDHVELLDIENCLSDLLSRIEHDRSEEVFEILPKIHHRIQNRKPDTNIFANITMGQGAELVSPGLVHLHEVIKITIPSDGATMRVKEQDNPIPVPQCCCVHPSSGHVMPIEGNVWYDVKAGVFTFSSLLDMESIAEFPIPFLNNKCNLQNDCFPSSSAPYAHLVPHNNGWPLNKDRDMIDPYFGLKVPVLGVTVDYKTGELTAVGGTMIDPATRMVKAIIIGDLYQDPESLEPYVVMGVTIDPRTLRVTPLGR